MKAFPGINTGIFNFMGDNPPWRAICDDTVMNNTLFFSFGKRIASPVLSHFMFNDKTPILPVDSLHTIDDTDANVLAQMILARYGEKWRRMLAINDAEYNPLNNYDMVEKEVSTATGTRNDSNSLDRADTRAITTTDADNQSVSTANTITGTTTGATTNATNATNATSETETADGDAAMYAFNSTDAVPTNETDAKTVKSVSGVNKQDDTITTDNKTATSDTGVTKSERDAKRAESASGVIKEIGNRTGISNDASTRTLTRSGNIGVTTSVQMLEQERKFWTWSYIRVIVEDVAAFLTIGVY